MEHVFEILTGKIILSQNWNSSSPKDLLLLMIIFWPTNYVTIQLFCQLSQYLVLLAHLS